MKDFPADVKLNSATLYLTATNRFAEEISSKFASYAIKQGSTSWSPPPVSSMTNWLPSLAEQWLDDHDSEDVILNRQHLQCHWMKFVLARPEGAKMLDVSGVAQSTFKAWLQCWQWGIALDAAQYASHDDWQLLVTWGNAFDRYLLENNITTEWHVAAKIIDKDGAWLVEFIGVSELVLVGFNKLPNRIQQLITMLAGAGVIVTAQEPLAEYEQALPSLYVCPDQNTELACVSEWCKAQLDENMQQKIAIVTPDLNSKRDAIARSLMQQIASDEYETGSWSLNPYFHFSNGQPFTAIAAVSHWFNAVKLIAHQIEFDIISTLLRANSLYSCTTEIQGRHQVDKHLRQSSKRRLSWKFVLSSLAVDCPRWHKFLIEIREKYRPSDQLSVAQYVAFMEEVTSALNWMAWPTKDSYSHQLTEQWFGQLQAFCQHVNRTETNTIDEWSRLLKYYVADAVFQPKFEDQPI